MSSNYVLLNQLFSYAQLNLENGPVGSGGQDESSGLHLPNSDAHTPSSATLHAFNGGPGGQTGLVSIVNLLSNEETLIPPSRGKTPQALTAEDPHHPQSSMARFRSAPTLNSRDGGRSNPADHASSSSNLSGLNTTRSRESSSQIAPLLATRRLEREYVRNYFHNLHYLHPMLDPADFMAMCEDYMWSVDEPNEKAKDKRHFSALYNIVVAVGALVAGFDVLNEFGRELRVYDENLRSRRGRQNPSPPFTSQMFSRIYFRKSWTLLGDVFEVCTLESAQTLFLMVSLRLSCTERDDTQC
jgi:hypothetical protein